MNGLAKKRYKDISFPFTCPITQRELKNSTGLGTYLTRTLKIDHKEYYDKFVNHRDKSCFFCGGEGKFISVAKGYRNLCDSSDCVKKSFASNTVEGIMYKEGCDKATAEKLFLDKQEEKTNAIKAKFVELRKDNPNFDKERSRNCKEFWLKKGYDIKESEEKAAEAMKDIHIKTANKFKADPEKYASKYKTKVEYYLKKGFTEEEAKKAISEIQSTFSLKKCIAELGEEEGTKKWQLRQDKWKLSLDSKTEEEKIEIKRKKLSGSFFSRVSQRFFWDIYNNVTEQKCYFKELNHEYHLYDSAMKTWYAYDFVSTSSSKCIEFHGDFWHSNPNYYNENTIHRVKKKKATEIWDFDKRKATLIESKGFDILTIWESEYRKDPQKTIEKCIAFLNKK